MRAITPESVLEAVAECLAQEREYCYAVSDAALYTREGRKEYEPVLADICRECGLEKKPDSKHIFGPEQTYIYASKQWEYPYALGRIRAMGNSALKIADVGGGRGVLAWYLARKGHAVTVYDVAYHRDTEDADITRRFIQFAAAGGFEAEFGSIFNIPEEDNTFDVVTCVSVLEHVRHKDYALRELLRVLKPGGRLILTYDLAAENGCLEGDGRVEIFTPETLAGTLRHSGISAPALYETRLLRCSLEDIQNDRVADIPQGLTVGGLTLTKARGAV
jgi:SAM-dependent methyltransferase